MRPFIALLLLCALAFHSIRLRADEKPAQPAAGKAAQKPPADGKSAPVDKRMFALGGMMAAHIYTTYGYIGTVADAYQHKVYKPKRVQQLMQEVLGMTTVARKGLVAAFGDDSQSAKDKKQAQAALEIYDLLQAEARALIAYSKSNSRNDADRFEKARQAAYPKIRVFLGIK